jgi:hypothetical protein
VILPFAFRHALSTIIVLSLTMVASRADAQSTNRLPLFDHALVPAASARAPLMPSGRLVEPETVRVLAVMVEFQEDSDSRTSGNGRFDLRTTPLRIIDPPPHDRSYFQHHVQFVENYFRRVSKGRLIVEGTVLDSVYRLPHQMATYSPPRTGTNIAELGRLVHDTWRTVDSLTPGLPFDRYSAFVIFHAGAGRDIDLVSLFGYDPTPFDIPSLYLNLAGLKRALGDSYVGVPVSGGSFHITNSMILPETENREFTSSGSTSLLQLGINGLFAASIGSHLGLPDLFDTRTGRSGIGRFGLMDGQSIFSWGGVFPPAPSAWERAFLGWVGPITVTEFDSVYSLPAVSRAGTSDTVYKVLINAREYFLIENRNRDANRDHAQVTLVVDGQTVTKTWPRDTTGFHAFNQDSLYGIVVDVDEFDWSLPGGVDSRTREWYDGGILIWHIDEGVIMANYERGTVNATPARRGVNLMEADGSQDIGQSYGFLSAGSGSEEGTPLDFWYAGNAAPLRQRSNAFTPSSNPSSLSNDLANSHVYISDFSSRAPLMAVRIRIGDDQIAPLPGFPKTLNKSVGSNAISAPVLPTGDVALAIATRQDSPASIIGNDDANAASTALLVGWRLDGSPLAPGLRTSGELASVGGILNVSTAFAGNPLFGRSALNGFSPFYAQSQMRAMDSAPVSTLHGWTTMHNSDSLAQPLFNIALSVSFSPTLVLVNDTLVVVGADHGRVFTISAHGVIAASLTDSSTVVGVSGWSEPSHVLATTSAGTLAQVDVSAGRIVRERAFGHSIAAPAVVGTYVNAPESRIALATSDGVVYCLDEMFNVLPGFPVSTGGPILNAPAIADIDGDGQKDIIVASGNRIVAINAAGAVVDRFPVTVRTASTILTSPIVADVNGNGVSDVVVVTQEGMVVAIDGASGRMVLGFPLAVGPNTGSTPAAFYIPSTCLNCVDIGLAVASDDGHVYAWKTGTLQVGIGAPPPQPWPQYMRDAQNSGLNDDRLTPTRRTSEFFPTSLAYNWPNPVGAEHDYRTHIRYFVGENAKVRIRIYDLSGDLVDQIESEGVGGMENDVVWNVTQIQSGVYFARIEAESGANNGVAVVKIAVVK